jgi:hypothetical protein
MQDFHGADTPGGIEWAQAQKLAARNRLAFPYGPDLARTDLTVSDAQEVGTLAVLRRAADDGKVGDVLVSFAVCHEVPILCKSRLWTCPTQPASAIEFGHPGYRKHGKHDGQDR